MFKLWLTPNANRFESSHEIDKADPRLIFVKCCRIRLEFSALAFDLGSPGMTLSFATARHHIMTVLLFIFFINQMFVVR